MCIKEYDFTFISNQTLRKNIEYIFDDINGLSGLETAMWFKKDGRIKNCLRKTVIIYTASIVEALLLWKIEEEVGSGKVTLLNEWKQYDTKVLHRDDDFELISAKRSREVKDVTKLDFNRMITLCRQEKLLHASLLKDLDALRKIRNKLHIGGVEEITKTYARNSVESALEILEKTMLSVQ